MAENVNVPLRGPDGELIEDAVTDATWTERGLEVTVTWPRQSGGTTSVSRVLSLSDDPSGGYLVPKQLDGHKKKRRPHRTR